MQEQYKHAETGVRSFIKKFMSLAYFNVEDINLAKQIIINDSERVMVSHPRLSEFVEYFNRQWMPILNEWNVHNLDDHTTNNDVEGWHRNLNEKLTKQNRCLPFWGFIDRIGKETLLDNHEYNNLLNGHAVGRASSRKVNADAQINRMKGIYDRSENGLTKEDNIRGFMEGLLNNY